MCAWFCKFAVSHEYRWIDDYIFYFRIPRVTVTQDEGHVELEISDDPYDVQTIDVKPAPCIVTLSKVFTFALPIVISFQWPSG